MAKTLRRSFTLIELILVMLIVCTVLAMASPNLRGFFSGRKAADTAGHMLALLRKCGQRAVAEGRCFRLVKLEKNGSDEEIFYRIEKMEDGIFRKLGEAVGKDFSVPLGVEIKFEINNADDPNAVRFFPDATADTGKITVSYGTDEVVLGNVCASEQFRITDDED